MPQGDKSSYSPKQKREAQHIEDSYKAKGASDKKAERIAWATVNKQDGGAQGVKANKTRASAAKMKPGKRPAKKTKPKHG